MPELTDDGRAALHTISDALNTLEEDAFGRWDAMNDVATAVGLDWQTATRDGILGRIKSALARVAELEAQLAAQGWRPLDAPPAASGEYLIGADYIPDVLLAEYHADTYMWYQQLPDGEWQLADWATHWRPLPPAPQEPTP